MDQTFRVALGETVAFVALPPLVIASWKVARGERGRAPWVLGGFAVLLLLTHLLSTIYTLLFVVPLVLLTLLGSSRRVADRRASLSVLALVGVLAVGSTAAWWLPVVVEQEHTAVTKIAPTNRKISPFAVTAIEPIQRRAWRRYGVRKKLTKTDDPGLHMPMYFGCGLLGLVGLALTAPGRREEEPDPLSGAPSPRLLGGFALGGVVMAIHPLAVLLDPLPLMGTVQFPWRLFAPASVFAGLAGGLALDRWAGGHRRLRAVLTLVALGMLAFDSAPYLGSAARWPDYEDQGFVVFHRERVIPVDVPRDEFIRVEHTVLPPSDYDWQVAKSRRTFPEYMSPKLYSRYGKSKPPSIERSEAYGASIRFHRSTGRRTDLEPSPLVAFRPDGERYAGLADASWTRKPEQITLELPAGLPEGNVRFTENWFPGWIGRVDGGPWSRALNSQGLLAVHVPEGGSRVELRYGLLTPWDRPVGLAISLLSLVGVAGAWRRYRIVTAAV